MDTRQFIKEAFHLMRTGRQLSRIKHPFHVFGKTLASGEPGSRRSAAGHGIDQVGKSFLTLEGFKLGDDTRGYANFAQRPGQETQVPASVAV